MAWPLIQTRSSRWCPILVKGCFEGQFLPNSRKMGWVVPGQRPAEIRRDEERECERDRPQCMIKNDPSGRATTVANPQTGTPPWTRPFTLVGLPV